jgi:hypothetical protein
VQKRHKIEISDKNSELLKDFTAFCYLQPNLRFWQAVIAWSGYATIYAEKGRESGNMTMEDLFYKEGK